MEEGTMIEIVDDAVDVKIGETVYHIRGTFGAMYRAVKLSDKAAQLGGETNPDAILATMGETKGLILEASDIPEAVFDRLSYGQIRQLMDVIRGTMTEEPGKN